MVERLKHPPLPEEESLGLGLQPGDPHYRAYVGPPEDYDLVAAMTFGLLTTLGLRQHHTLLDLGCGSLRNARLFIPYLNRDKYLGIEPNEWLVQAGIEREIGETLVRIKRPQFFFFDSPALLREKALAADFAVAQSIFSHCGLDLMASWLSALAESLVVSGALLATFLPGAADSSREGWVYPECVRFRTDTIVRLAGEVGLGFQILDWKHPRQTWALFTRAAFDTSWFAGKPLTWNTWLQHSVTTAPRRGS
jgi:hypothetical protein